MIYFIVTELTSKLQDKVLCTIPSFSHKQRESLQELQAALPRVEKWGDISTPLAATAGVLLDYVYPPKSTGFKHSTVPRTRPRTAVLVAYITFQIDSES